MHEFKENVNFNSTNKYLCIQFFKSLTFLLISLESNENKRLFLKFKIEFINNWNSDMQIFCIILNCIELFFC